MIDLGGCRARVRAATLIAVAVGLLGALVNAGSLPHTHAADLPGLYNQEHDLTLLAAVGGVGPIPDSPSVAPVALVALLVVPAIARQPLPRPDRPADSRAPPAR